MQGYSAVLNLYLRWQDGDLVFHDQATGRRILTLEDERARATVAEAELSLEREARITGQARAAAAEAELAAERARVRELEGQLRRRDS